MQFINDAVSVAAGASSGNVLLGSIFEFLKKPSIVAVGCTVPAAGAGFLTASFSVGDTIVTDPPYPVPTEVGVGRGVTTDSDMRLSSGGLPGDRLSLNFTNTDVNPHVVTFRVQVV